MWNGYLEVGGVDIVNAERTEAYVNHLMPGAALRRIYNTDVIHLANEEDAYRSPVLDPAPWVNPLDAATQDFLGLYPISMEGLDDSTLAASVTEYLADGGSVGLQRDGSKPIRVTGLLVGTSMLGAQAGLAWLTAALRSGDCTDCNDGVLRYFVAQPDICATGAFGEENGTDSRSFGRLGPGVYRYTFPTGSLNTGMPLRARWTAQWGEGTAITYGLAPRDSITPLVQSLPVTPLRRNYAPNPTFRSSLASWNTSGSGTADLRADGGVDNGAFARLTAQAQGYTPDTSAPFGAAPFGSSAFGGGAPASTGSAYLAFTAKSLASMAAGVKTVSLALRSTTSAPAMVSLSIGGVQYANVSVPTTTNWQRFTVSTVATPAGVVTMNVGTSDTVDVDQVSLELGASQKVVVAPVTGSGGLGTGTLGTMALGGSGTTSANTSLSHSVGDYFDGTTVEPGFVVMWEGAQDTSVARRSWTGVAEDTWADSTVRPVLTLIGGSADAVQLTWGLRSYQTMAEQLLPYERHMFDVSCTQGPQVIQQVDAGGGGAFIQVDFTLVAGNPAAFSLPEEIDTTPLANAAFTDPDDVLTTEDISWLTDPNSITITRPPTAPVILNPAIESIDSWQRYYVPIPAKHVADWTESIPTLTLTSLANPITQVRVRFHPNPFHYAPSKVDPTSYCSEFVVSYLPAVTSLEVDGVLQRATASRGDRSSTNADHLLYGSGGGPISWPRLSCAIDYLLTIDVPPGGTIDAFNVDLALRRKQ